MLISLALVLCAAALAGAQTATPAPAQEKVPFSHHALSVTEYSQQENEAIVAKFRGLRVTDVVDALDEIGLQDVTIMDQEIKPLWRDEEKFTHRIYGVAVTVRLAPGQERAPVFEKREDFKKWQSEWLRKFPRPKQAQFLKPDTILVMDAPRARDVGQCGSENAYNWMLNGMRGIVAEGGCRDTDELILERIPVYERAATRGTYMGRMVTESWNAPVTVGGVLVMPNDVIVADGNGVVVVPRAKAELVAERAHLIQENDKAVRRKHYDRAKRPQDFTTK
jgi:4-hydroxy-4-methyl-2-oxoglutarate aldolase